MSDLQWALWIPLTAIVAGALAVLGDRLVNRSHRRPPEPERPGFGSNIIKNGRCPDCGSEKWLEGPHGGMSINIKCANQACGSKFNVGPGSYCERI